MSCCWKSGDKIHIYYLLWFTWFLNFFKKPRLFPSCFVSFLKCVTGWCIFFLIYILWPSPKLCFSSQDLIFDMFWLSAPPCRGLLPAYESLVVSIIVSLFPLIGPPVLGAFKYLQLNHIFIHFCNEQAQQNTQRVSTLSSCWMCWTVSTPLKRYWTVQTPQEITEQSISNWVILTTDEPNSGTVLRSSKLLRFRITRVHAVVSRWKQSRKKLANRKGPKHLGPYQQVKCMSYSMTNLHAWNSLYTHHSRRMSVWGPYVFFIRLLIQQIILISAPLHVVQIYPQCLFHPPQLGSQNWLGVVDVTVVLTTDINFFQTWFEQVEISGFSTGFNWEMRSQLVHNFFVRSHPSQPA